MKIEETLIIRIDDPRSRNYAAECAESCVRYGLKFKYLEGFDCSFVSEKSFHEKTGLRPRASLGLKDNLVFASHVKAWKKVASENRVVAILEHDVIVKHEFDGIDVNGHIVLLGYRVDGRLDYEHPGGDTEVRPAMSFEGTHAYALSPMAAVHLLDRLRNKYVLTIPSSVTEFVRDAIESVMVDPPVAVAEVGNSRESTVFKTSARMNFLPFPGFFRGLRDGVAKKLVIDGGSGWLKF